MCGSPDVDTSAQDFAREEAERARAEEEARQLRIDEGMKQIAAIFEGGEYAAPVGDIQAQQVQAIANPEYEAIINGTTPVMSGGGVTPDSGTYQPLDTASMPIWNPTIPAIEGLNVGDWYVPEITQRGETMTYAGMAPVLAQREAAMRGFYLPQLDQQFKDAGDDLAFALSRAGQLTSSTAGQKQAKLSEAFGLQRAALEGDIAADLASTQQSINQNRQSLEAGLRASGDATAAANAALQSAVTFRNDSPPLDPLANLFVGLSQGIGAVRDGYETGRVRSLATPNPLSSGTGRVVG